ncbi:DUF6197 family protein [[Kitasatospora] papulosa]|uniref:DUF6197 family protein n=1 Tax=Streptomyces TaxID=1883 RepID=UPI00343FAA1A
MPTRHTPESIVIADTPAAILEWAARHIEHVGIHQGPRLFAGPGRTATLPCWPRGALEVAVGHGRGAAGRTYDWDRIDRARDQAFAILAETLTGHPPSTPTTSPPRPGTARPSTGGAASPAVPPPTPPTRSAPPPPAPCSNPRRPPASRVIKGPHDG